MRQLPRKNTRSKVWLAVYLIIYFVHGMANAQTINGFDLTRASIPARQILSGGPPRDGIPAIDRPVFQSVSSATWLDPEDRILGVSLNGISRAYPIAILNWHEVVNDVIGGRPIVISYCPLCGTGMAFDSRIENRDLDFGVSGLLYQSDVLLYDRQTESLWSQIIGEAISGPHQGKKLGSLVLAHTSWGAWQQAHPDTEVLSRDTGVRRDYTQDPYAGYGDSPRILFPVVNRAPGPWHAKEWVLGVELNGQYKAYPFTELAAQGLNQFTDEFAGETITIVWDEENRSAAMRSGNEVQPSITAFWFAWYAFHTQTEVFRARE
ncbi:MAG: DUF3179 domain-containing protein [Pseudohongiellaceae bacterium]